MWVRKPQWGVKLLVPAMDKKKTQKHKISKKPELP